MRHPSDLLRNMQDIGVACQSGQVFPLTEGMTGAVVAHRGPVWFARYEDVHGGHVAPEERAALRGVIGVPLEWRGRIIGACIVFSSYSERAFGSGDADLLQLFARHAAIALATARMHEAAEERARAEATAAERDRLLGEVHDSLAQRLVSVRVHLDSAEQELAGGTGPAGPGAAGSGAAAEHVRLASEAARDALVEARLTLLGLAASPLDGRTLEAALRAETSWAQTVGGLEVGFVSAGTPVVLDGGLSLEVVRVAREALTNIVRHAQAHSVRLGLLYDRAAVSLLIQDDGQGFDPKSGWQADRFGLRAMTERAQQLGASIEVDSLAGWGTRIRASFPYLRDEEQAGSRLRVLIAAGRYCERVSPGRCLDRAGDRGDGEVRALMEQGMPDKLIAERLVLSVKTVEKHAGSVLRKTGARNRTELAALAGRGRP